MLLNTTPSRERFLLRSRDRRLESTASVGVAPLQQYRADGIRGAPSLHVSAAIGDASRTHYFGAGGGYQYFGAREGDHFDSRSAAVFEVVGTVETQVEKKGAGVDPIVVASVK